MGPQATPKTRKGNTRGKNTGGVGAASAALQAGAITLSVGGAQEVRRERRVDGEQKEAWWLQLH